MIGVNVYSSSGTRIPPRTSTPPPIVRHIENMSSTCPDPTTYTPISDHTEQRHLGATPRCTHMHRRWELCRDYSAQRTPFPSFPPGSGRTNGALRCDDGSHLRCLPQQRPSRTRCSKWLRTPIAEPSLRSYHHHCTRSTATMCSTPQVHVVLNAGSTLGDPNVWHLKPAARV